MARIIRNNIRSAVRTFQDPGSEEKFDRIIADIPSFIDRWGGKQGLGTLRDQTSVIASLAMNNLTEDGTVTVSCTGVAEEKWDEWFEAEGKEHFELVPNSTWTMFRPDAFYTPGDRFNKQFWHRRDDWTHVRTYRRIGSDFTINREAWPTFTHWPNWFHNYPWPDSMNDVEVSAFRSPVHKGINEAKELQKWLTKNGIGYEEVTDSRGIDRVFSIEKPGHKTTGYIVQFSTDPADWYHIPKTICTHVGDNIGFTRNIINKFEDPDRPGLQNLRSGNHRYVMLASWIVATHTNPGDKILDPFCGMGSLVAAAVVNNRNVVGVEMNPGRADNAARVLIDLQ